MLGRIRIKLYKHNLNSGITNQISICIFFSVLFCGENKLVPARIYLCFRLRGTSSWKFSSVTSCLVEMGAKNVQMYKGQEIDTEKGPDSCFGLEA
jgi:hypothetical protein